MIETLKLASEKYNIKYNIYGMKKTKDVISYEMTERIGSTDSDKEANLLLLSGNNETHICYIKNVENLTKCHICKKCNNYMVSIQQHGNYIDKHVENCDGVNKPKVILKKCTKLYLPHIFRNDLYAFLYANNRLNEYQYLGDYVTFDFETVTKTVQKSFGKSSFQDSTLHPLSVAWTTHLNGNNKSEFLYCDQMNEKSFINK
jgi:hypothetical protein